MKALALVIMLSLPAASLACDMCRDASPVSSPDLPGKRVQEAEAGLGFNSSIYFMLASLGVAGVLTGRTILKAMRDGASTR